MVKKCHEGPEQSDINDNWVQCAEKVNFGSAGGGEEQNLVFRGMGGLLETNHRADGRGRYVPEFVRKVSAKLQVSALKNIEHVDS